MSARTFTLCALLLLPLAAPVLAAQDAPLLPVERLLLDLGVAREDLDAVVVERRVWAEGSWTSARVGLADVAALPAAAPLPSAPHAVVGQVPVHVMLQTSCAGYGAQAHPGGLTSVDGSWDFGFHLVVGALAGGVAVDTMDPGATLTASGHPDLSALALGDLALRETRLHLFGHCLLLIGEMHGTGVFAFDARSPL